MKFAIIVLSMLVSSSVLAQPQPIPTLDDRVSAQIGQCTLLNIKLSTDVDQLRSQIQVLTKQLADANAKKEPPDAK